VTIITDETAPETLQAFLARRKLADRKPYWVPLVWGPGYATGGSIFGCVGRFEYAAEAKNAALSARPEEWDARHRGFDAPTASGRLGWRPAAAWALGVSGSSGPYLRERASRTLAPGRDVGDFRETVVGADLSYARRHLQVWAEFLAGRFEVPIARPARTVDADTAAYYLEGRYKVTPSLFAALRWNQQFFGEVPDGQGGQRAWDRNAWRVDTALGYRFDRHLQAKLQYSVGQQAGRVQQGEQLVAAQMTLKF
jgi:predicted porin